MRYAVEIAYDGTPFHGWQRQQNAISVQQEIEESLSTLLRGEYKIQGCGRTDTGVHAEQYFFHFDGDLIDENKFVYSLNQILKDEVTVLHIYHVGADFHSRFDATSRAYRYAIHQKKNPFISKWSWLMNRALDVDKMNEACSLLLKYEDFGSFCKSKSQNKTNICRLSHAHWVKTEGGLEFEIKADRFLRNMVRAIVGTMLEIGLNKMNLEEFKTVIEAKDRSAAGFSVPAHGLFLTEVVYDKSNWKLIEQGR